MKKAAYTTASAFQASPALCLRRNVRTGKALLAFLLLSVSFAFSSYAVPTLEFFETPNPAVTSTTPGGGVVSFTGTVNDFSVNVMGITKPAAGSATNPQLYQIDTTITNTSNATATLSILFSDTGFGPTAAIPMAAFSASANGIVAGAQGSVTYKTYADAGNSLFGTTTLLTSQGPMVGTFSNAMATGPLVSLSSFSLTQVLEITLPAGGTYNGTAQLTFGPSSVPEGGASGIVLLGLALVGIELLRRSCGGLLQSKLQTK